MAATLNASKFKVKLDSKEYSDVLFYAGSRISIEPRPAFDNDGSKGTVMESGNVSFSAVTIRRPFTPGDGTWMDWVQSVKKSGANGNKKTIGITVFDESEAGKLEYTLNNAWPTSYGHSPLQKGAGGGGQVVEEITLSVEDVEYKALN